MASGPDGVVAVEFKCLETLSRHVAEFSPAYDAEIRDNRRQTTWFREMQRLVAEPQAYAWLDAAQLVKHAFGLAYTFPNDPVTLLYVYWEPSNARAYPMFAEHRAEIVRFSAAVAGSGPGFAAMTYPELWEAWDDVSAPEWLRTHVTRLRKRYDVAA